MAQLQASARPGVMLQGMLQAFVEYIKDRKTVVLEELAAHFSLRVQVTLEARNPSLRLGFTAAIKLGESAIICVWVGIAWSCS